MEKEKRVFCVALQFSVLNAEIPLNNSLATFRDCCELLCVELHP